MDFEHLNEDPITVTEANIPTEDPFMKPDDTGAIPSLPDYSTENNHETLFSTAESKKGIFMLLLTVIITLTIGGIITFVVVTNSRASVKKDDPYERYKNIAVPTKASTATPTKVPALEIVAPVATKEATPSAQISTKPEEEWKLVFDEPVIKVSSLEQPSNSVISSTLFGPLEIGTMVCVEKNRNTHQYFTQKKGQIFEKICQEDINANVPRFTCMPYDPATGIIIDEPLLPANSCADTSSLISTGTYVLYSKVFYNCTIEGKAQRSITESDCLDSVDVSSEELSIED